MIPYNIQKEIYLKIYEKTLPKIADKLLDYNDENTSYIQILEKAAYFFLEKEKEEITISLAKDEIIINKISNNKFEISSSKVYDIYNKIPLISIDNLWRFNAKLKDLGVYDFLKKKGIKNGDIVKILDYEFSWNDEF